MKILKNTLIILFVLSMSVLLPTNVAYAGTDLSPSGVVKEGKDFLSEGDSGTPIFNEENQKAGVDQVYYSLFTISIVVAVLIGVILGIQFITSGAAGQAKVKEKLVPFGIGALVVFGSFAIWKIAYDILNRVMPQ